MFHFFSFAICPIYFKFVLNKDMHIISHEIVFRPCRTTNKGVICLERLKYSHRLKVGIMMSPLAHGCLNLMSPLFEVTIDPIHLKLVGLEDVLNILSSTLSRIGPLTVEFAALKSIKSRKIYNLSQVGDRSL